MQNRYHLHNYNLNLLIKLCFHVAHPATLLDDLLIYLHETQFMQNSIKSRETIVAKSHNSLYRYIDGVLSFTYLTFGD